MIISFENEEDQVTAIAMLMIAGEPYAGVKEGIEVRASAVTLFEKARLKFKPVALSPESRARLNLLRSL